MTADWMRAERAAPPPRPHRNTRRNYLAEIEALREHADPADLAVRRHEAALAAEGNEEE